MLDFLTEAQYGRMNEGFVFEVKKVQNLYVNVEVCRRIWGGFNKQIGEVDVI